MFSQKVDQKQIRFDLFGDPSSIHFYYDLHSCVGGEYRLAVGARPHRAVLLCDEEKFLSGGVKEDSVKVFANWAKEQIPTGNNHRAGAAYRTRLIGVLSQRLFCKIGEA